MRFPSESVAAWSRLGRRAYHRAPREFDRIRRLYSDSVPLKTVRAHLENAFKDFTREAFPSHASVFWFLHFTPAYCVVCKERALSFVRQTRSSPRWCSVSCKNKDETNKLYGKDNPASSPEVQSKIKRRFAKYLGGHPLRDPSVVRKLKNTCLDRYGVENPWSSTEVKERIVATNYARYGARSHMQNPDVAERVLSKAYQRTQVRLLGSLHTVQGFEGLALKEIEAKLLSVETRRTGVPPIWYRNSGVLRRYYPDAVVTSITGKRFVLEIKSDWTLVRESKRNLAKLAALRRWCRQNGYEFALYVKSKDASNWFANPTAQHCRRIVCKYAVGKSLVRWKE